MHLIMFAEKKRGQSNLKIISTAIKEDRHRGDKEDQEETMLNVGVVVATKTDRRQRDEEE